MERSYIAFISYRHTKRDAAIAKRVHTLIENYIIPKSLRKDGKKLGVVFRDEEELPIASDLSESIRMALDASRYLIVICSPEANESPWVKREVNYFLKNHDAQDAFVVLADGEPKDVFPRELTYVLNKRTGEFQEVEPLAMDVRADSIGAALKKTNTYIKKLYAGMLGCSYDRLVQREKLRRLKRMMALTALCLVLVSCFIGMLFVKNRELSQRNEELQAAIELTLLRESEILVEQSDKALADGDTLEAIRYASDALYSAEVERPYYAPAERALFSAMDVLKQEENTVLLSKIALEHRSPIEMMACSADGSSVYTMDTYGLVNRFDAATGDLVWTVALSHDSLWLLNVSCEFWYLSESNMLICHYENTVMALDGLTGASIWQLTLQNTASTELYFDAEGQRLAYIEALYHTYPDDPSAYYTDYSFIALSALDGSLLHRIPMVRMDDLNPAYFFSYFSNCPSGVFAGPDRFIGTFYEYVDGVSENCFYIVNLKDNTTLVTQNECPHEWTGRLTPFYIGDDKALVVSEVYDIDPETWFFTYQLRLQCFDLQTNSRLWETTVDGNVSSDDLCCLVPNAQDCVIGVGDLMLAVDSNSGEVLASTTLQADILHLESLADGLFAFTLADGYCAIGWRNQSGLHDSRSFGATADLPDTPAVLSCNGGLIQVYFTDNQIDGFSRLPPEDGGGSMIYLSEDRCTAYIASVLRKPALPDPIPVTAADATMSDIGDFIDMNPQGKVLTGRVLLQDGYGLAVVDPATHSFEIIPLDADLYFSFQQFYLTGDGSRVLGCSNSGDVYSIQMDGTLTSIAESEDITLRIVGDTEYGGNRFNSDAARQTTDGRILIARSDGVELTWWLDGEEETSIPLPEAVCWQQDGGLMLYEMLHTGENGLIVLSDFASTGTAALKNFAVYDLKKNRWTLVPDAAHGSYDRMIAFSESDPLFAVYDEDMCIRIYDGRSAQLLHCIPTELPAISIEEMRFLLDDRYICILTQDSQFIVYLVETGGIVFRTLLGSSYSSGVSTWVDGENDRLYLCMSSNDTVFCIDTRNWEVLFEQENVRFYSPTQNEIYVYSMDQETYTYSLKAYPILTTTELTELALSILQ